MKDQNEKPALIRVGWREWVSLPELNINSIVAKIDTGARTSALHATDITKFEKDTTAWVRFTAVLQKGQDLNNPTESVTVECPLEDERAVRSSNGTTELRPVIATTLSIAGSHHRILLTLTDRHLMSYRMLLGREALSNRFLVDTALSYQVGTPPSKDKGEKQS